MQADGSFANLLAQDIAPIGDPGRRHIVAVEGHAPKYDGGIVTSVECQP